MISLVETEEMIIGKIKYIIDSWDGNEPKAWEILSKIKSSVAPEDE